MNTAEAKEMLTQKGEQVTVAGSGKEIVDASAEKGSQLLQNDRIILLTDKPAMPDIIGWSQRDVLQLADLLELKVEIMGSGFVDRKSTRLNSSHVAISYAVFCLKRKI